METELFIYCCLPRFCTRRQYGTYSDHRSPVVVLISRWTAFFLILHNLIAIASYGAVVASRVNTGPGVSTTIIFGVAVVVNVLAIYSDNPNHQENLSTQILFRPRLWLSWKQVCFRHQRWTVRIPINPTNILKDYIFGPFPASFSFIFVISIMLTIGLQMFYKKCRCLDSKHGSLVSEATTEPHPLPFVLSCYNDENGG